MFRTRPLQRWGCACASPSGATALSAAKEGGGERQIERHARVASAPRVAHVRDDSHHSHRREQHARSRAPEAPENAERAHARSAFQQFVPYPQNVLKKTGWVAVSTINRKAGGF